MLRVSIFCLEESELTFPNLGDGGSEAVTSDSESLPGQGQSLSILAVVLDAHSRNKDISIPNGAILPLITTHSSTTI